MELNEKLIMKLKKFYLSLRRKFKNGSICIDKITEKDLWNKPSKKGVAIGNQIIHIVGNMTQYLISALGEKNLIEKEIKNLK